MISEKTSRSQGPTSSRCDSICEKKISPVENFVADLELLRNQAEEVEKTVVDTIDRILGQQKAEIREGSELAKAPQGLLNSANEFRICVQESLKRIKESVQRL